MKWIMFPPFVRRNRNITVCHVTTILTERNKQRPLCAVALIIVRTCSRRPCEVSVTVLIVLTSALCVSGYQLKLILKAKFQGTEHTSPLVMLLISPVIFSPPWRHLPALHNGRYFIQSCSYSVMVFYRGVRLWNFLQSGHGCIAKMLAYGTRQ
jgi:hypothetical protein